MINNRSWVTTKEEEEEEKKEYLQYITNDKINIIYQICLGWKKSNYADACLRAACKLILSFVYHWNK